MKEAIIWIFFLLLVFCSDLVFAQEQKPVKKKTVSVDTLGRPIDMMDLIGITMTGRYKIVYDDTHPEIYLAKPVARTKHEFDSLLNVRKTEKDFLCHRFMGKEFPEFNVTDRSRKRFRSSDLRGKVLVLNFWFVECSPCKVEMPELNLLLADYSENEKVIFLSFSFSEEKKVRKFLSETKFDYPVTLTTLKQTSAFGIKGYPTNMVIDMNGICSFASEGVKPGGVHLLKMAIDEALEISPPGEQ